jgi:acetyl esterase
VVRLSSESVKLLRAAGAKVLAVFYTRQGLQMSGNDLQFYKNSIDAETWNFIEETAAYFPAEYGELDISAQRHLYDAMCRHFHAGYPKGVSAKDDEILDRFSGRRIAVRHYYYNNKSVEAACALYLHGGGFVLGGLESHDDVCAELCAGSGLDVVSVDYSLSPEHPFPDDLEDAWTVFSSLSKARPVILVGDSAGACLCAAISQKCREAAFSLVGQILIYPSLGGDKSSGSYVTHADAPMLTTADLWKYHELRSRGNQKLASAPEFAPLQASDFGRLPPTAIFSAEIDPLAQDAREYHKRLSEAGCDVTLTEEKGLVHGYLRARHRTVLASESFARILSVLREFAQRV